MKIFCLLVYQLFDACIKFDNNGLYKIVDSDGRYLVKAHNDRQHKRIILTFLSRAEQKKAIK